MKQAPPLRLNFAHKAAVFLPLFVATCLLGVVLAYWTWAWVAPRPRPVTTTATEAAVPLEAAGALFGSSGREAGVPAPTGLAIKLLGVVAASGGRVGYALLQLDGREVLPVHEGAEIAPGIRVAEVHADRIVLDRSGAREMLTWPSTGKPPTPQAGPTKK